MVLIRTLGDFLKTYQFPCSKHLFSYEIFRISIDVVNYSKNNPQVAMLHSSCETGGNLEKWRLLKETMYIIM
jgi:hypothetical protein